MNERIRELEAQCWEERKYGPPWFNANKFAELIVRECIDTLDQMPVYYKNENDREIERNTISDCIRAIEQRFGI
jgi:hypothetical protein